jgi:hypothetical protein
MRRFHAILSTVVVFALGYAIGSFQGHSPQPLRAVQDPVGDQFSPDVLAAYKKANKGIQELNNLFIAGGQSTNAFGGLNYFAASVGGIDAERDLEEGRGVDPETFAALYADLASTKVSQHLDKDELGRLRYKKNVIRIYSRDKLKQLFDKRDQLADRSDLAP